MNQIQHDAVKIAGKISTNENQIKLIENDINTVTTGIKQYYDNEERIKNNNLIKQQLVSLDKQISDLEIELKQQDVDYKKILSNLSVLRSRKDQSEDNIQKLVDIEQKILDYDLYLMTLSRDGIQYELISRTIPIIEKEVNEVLDHMMVGFTLKL